jgi:hypothetical protein
LYGFLLVLGLGGVVWAQQSDPPLHYALENPELIETQESCRQCHVSEYDVWAKTAHSTGFKTQHRKEAAEKIAKAMGFKLIKRNSLCVTCHYTAKVKKGQLRAIAGVSCESCHGAGGEWVNVHNNYGGTGFTFENETAEHKAMRIKKSRELGMRRPSDLYPVVARCYECHIVPNEKLVDVGGHGTADSDFEYVKWSQGVIKHNFLESFLTGDGTVNADRTPARTRVMYVVGRAVELEYCIRAMATAKSNKRFFKTMKRRTRAATNELKAINRKVSIPEVDKILAMAKDLDPEPNSEPALTKAADQIGLVTQEFIKNNDGSGLGAIDSLLGDIGASGSTP